MLGFAPGSQGSSSTQLIIAFLISGLIHAGGDFLVRPDYFGVTAPFFFYQIIGITVEDITLQILSKSGIKVPPFLSTVLGYVWVCFWFTLTAPSLIHGLAILGLQSNSAKPASPSMCMNLLRYLQRTGMVVPDFLPTPHAIDVSSGSGS
jgi:hypothetical protein